MTENILQVKRNDEFYYPIVFRKNFEDLSNQLKTLELQERKCCIVTDSNVAPIYLETVKKELEKVSDTIISIILPAGEENKTLVQIQNIYEHLIKAHFDRKDLLFALGGGVVGDMTGFAAATYLRGIDFIQIPTTLLAQVDSSIGGKTGVDFLQYKNMVGAFHQPRLVYMNISVLNSLSDRLFNSGFGEIIKHGFIKDSEYYNWLVDNSERIKTRDYNALEQMIAVSCNIKRKVVELDPTEKGDRALLNFGHTLGHAIEKLKNFELYHGECVVLGMIAALDISRKRHLISDEEFDKAIDTFKKYDFPTTVTGIDIEDVIKVSKNDKKMDAGKIKFILLGKIGTAYIDKTVTDDEMREALKLVVK